MSTTSTLGPKPVVGRWTGVLLAGLTGFLYFVSFPGLDIWPVAFVAWLPWLVALRGQTPGWAVLQGLAVGLVAQFFGFYWLLGMLETFSGFPRSICLVLMVLLCSYQAGIFMMVGWLYARGARRGWPVDLVFPLAFIASETSFPLLFPFTFGATMHDVYPMVQVADLGGPVAVALVTLAPSWALAPVVSNWLLGRGAGRSLLESLRMSGMRRTALLLAVPLAAAVYGLVRIGQVDAAVAQAEKTRVGIVQANMALAAKRENISEGLRRHAQLTRKLRKEHHAELVVWPETSVAGAVPEGRLNEHYRRTVTRRLKVPAIIGAVVLREVDDQRDYVLFNSALISNKKGKIVGRYDKQFLLAFGEYLPLGDRFPILYEWSQNSSRFSPGTSFEPLRFRDHDIAVFICYEDIVPSFVNKLMQHGNPELLVNMTNDAWFGDSSEPWEHMALSKLRAVEQRRFFIRATNSGISGIVDPVGRLIVRTETFEQAAVSADIAFLQLPSLYRVVGNSIWWALSALALLLAFVRRPNRKTTPRPHTTTSNAD